MPCALDDYSQQPRTPVNIGTGTTIIGQCFVAYVKQETMVIYYVSKLNIFIVLQFRLAFILFSFSRKVCFSRLKPFPQPLLILRVGYNSQNCSRTEFKSIAHNCFLKLSNTEFLVHQKLQQSLATQNGVQERKRFQTHNIENEVFKILSVLRIVFIISLTYKNLS